MALLHERQKALPAVLALVALDHLLHRGHIRAELELIAIVEVDRVVRLAFDERVVVFDSFA